jgi:hypothetical protein
MLSEARPERDDAFEFSFEGGERGEAPVDPGELGHTTLLDPAAGSGLDISSSDLDYSREPAPATKIIAFGDEGPASLPLAAEDAELDLAESDPFDAPLADAGEAFGGADPFATTMPPTERAPRDPSFDPFERDPFEEAPVMEAEPLSAGEELDEEPEFAAEPAAAAELDADPWDDAGSFEPAASVAAEDESPAAGPAVARADLRDAIEKIAWDAFGPITEKIVREAIARIEQVAWEVVPKLAETLIQEEIRRLKGGSSS